MHWQKSLSQFLDTKTSAVYAAMSLSGASFGYLLWKFLSSKGAVSKKKKKNTVPGLLNVGNSCFMNVLLQSFVCSPKFVVWIKRFSNEAKNDQNRIYLAQIINKILDVLEEGLEHCDYYDPSELLTDMAGRGWQISSEEQDSHEFYHALVTTLTEEYEHQIYKNLRVLDFSCISEVLLKPSPYPVFNSGAADRNFPKLCSIAFRGTLASILQCQACGHQNSVRYDAFDSLSLPLPSNIGWLAQSSLVECLTYFTASEVIQNVGCENCYRLQSNKESMCAKDINALENKGLAEECKKAEPDSSDKKIEDATPSQLKMKLVETNSIDTNERFISITDKVTDSHQDNPQPHTIDACTPKTSGGFSASSKITLLQKKTANKHLKNSHKCQQSPLDFDRPLYAIKQSFRQSICLGKLPQTLCFHIQRLVWIQGTPTKKMNFVRFPEILDVTPFTDISRQLAVKSCQNRFNSLYNKDNGSAPAKVSDFLQAKDIPEKDDSSTKESGLLKARLSRRLYRLISVIVHIGSWSYGGHFVAYRRSRQRDKSGWIFTSDTLVRKATYEEVFSCPAYMLFYERIQSDY